MTSRTKKLLAAAVALAFAAAAPSLVQAQEMGAYVGASIAQAKAKDFCDTGGEPGLVVSSCDDKADAWKLLAGYRFHRNFAAEATYLQTGDMSVSGTYLGAPFSGKGDGRAFGIAALGIMPVGQRVELFGKLGVLRTEIDASATVLGTSLSFGEDETEAHFGMGAIFKLTRNWGVRAEWERAEKSKIDLLSLGVQYAF